MKLCVYISQEARFFPNINGDLLHRANHDSHDPDMTEILLKRMQHLQIIHLPNLNHSALTSVGSNLPHATILATRLARKLSNI